MAMASHILPPIARVREGYTLQPIKLRHPLSWSWKPGSH